MANAAHGWGGWLGLFLLVGCSHVSAKAEDPISDSTYRIGREDVLDVAVWRDADLSRVVPVRPDGYISLPMVGELQADGKTTAQLEEAIRQKLVPYVQDPRVSVMLHEVNSTRIYVTGEVAHPGGYLARGKISVLQAIALAGGLTEFASSDGIKVVRAGSRSGPISVRYGDLVESRDFLLRPGDTVVVP
jgi:polysaccharide export outer membrane protein